MCSSIIYILLACISLFISIYVAILFKSQKLDLIEFDVSASSVVCDETNFSGNSIYNRRCKFTNLCYKVDSDEFLFFLDTQRSLLINVPDDRFKPVLQYLGSVEHNNFGFNYVDVNYTLYRELLANYELIIFKEPTLIYARFKPDNLMHILHDDLLPLYHTLRLSTFSSDQTKNYGNFIEADFSKKISIPKLQWNLFQFDNYHKIKDHDDQLTKSFYNTFFQNVNLLYKQDFQAQNQLICFKNVEIGLDKTTVWYDYGFKRFQSAIPKSVNQAHLIRQYSDEMRNLILKNHHTSLVLECSQKNVVLIQRKRSRLILNEDELIDRLEKTLESKVLKLDYEVESLETIIRTLSCAQLIIGMHGSGLILTLFMPENANLIELFPFKINSTHLTPYKQLAKIKNLHYYTWTNNKSENNFFNMAYLRPEIKDAIKAEKEVTQSLCCDEAYFLFRIYQDTIVDLDELNDQILVPIKNRENHATSGHQTSLQIAPSKVRFNCSRTSEEQEIKLEWTKPWNILRSDSDFNYEILISSNGKASRMFSTKAQTLTFEIDHNVSALVWIRALNNDVQGPFNDRPIYC